MQTKLPASRSRFETTSSFETPTVVILYCDLPAGERAMRVITNAFGQLEDGTEFRSFLWRLDLLEDPDWLALASSDLLEGNIFVFAASDALNLSPKIKGWLKAGILQKRGENLAILAIAPENHDRIDPTAFRFLRDVAHDAHADFLEPNEAGALRHDFSHRPHAFPAWPSRYWGLNE